MSSKARDIGAATRRILAERFPKAFMPTGAVKIPLKVGVKEDILAASPDLTRGQVTKALRDYCRGEKYLRAMVVGARRIGLDGADAGFVSSDEARGAAMLRARLDERVAAAQERRAKAAEAQGAAA